MTDSEALEWDYLELLSHEYKAKPLTREERLQRAKKYLEERGIATWRHWKAA